MNNIYPFRHPDKFVYRWDTNTIRIGTDDTDVWEINDPDQIWETLINLCDGQKNLHQICKEMHEKFSIEEENIVNALDKFAAANSLTLRSEPYKKNNFQSRFGPNICYFSSEGLNGETVVKQFRNMKVAVLGAGGGGSQFIMQLVGLGVGHIKIADYDRVELSNLPRQLPYEFQDVGEYKVIAAKKYIENRDPEIIVETYIQQLNSVDTIESIIEGVDWVFCAMDEPPYIGQRRVNKACINMNIPCLFAFSQRQNARMFEVIPGETGCADCCLKHTAEHSPTFVPFVRALKNARFSPETALIPPTMTLLSSWVIKRWVDIVTGKEKKVGNKFLRFDFHTYETREVTVWKKDEACPTCGSAPLDSALSKELWELIPIEEEAEKEVSIHV